MYLCMYVEVAYTLVGDIFSPIWDQPAMTCRPGSSPPTAWADLVEQERCDVICRCAIVYASLQQRDGKTPAHPYLLTLTDMKCIPIYSSVPPTPISFPDRIVRDRPNPTKTSEKALASLE
jgi:hypothetical protein